MNLGKYIRKGALPALMCLSLASCKNSFDLEPKDALELKQMYRNVYDADAAVLGVYGKFIGLAKQYVILNELRGDLMDVTDRADNQLYDISVHKATESNEYANPRPFYEIILYCNDVLYNLNQMKQKNLLTEQEYNERYSDIGTLRSWLYLQVGIHWGSVPYVTDPLANVNDLADEKNYPKLSFQELLTKLVDFTESLPWKGFYTRTSTLFTTIDGYPTYKFFAVKSLVLGDLYLWKGNYTMAATRYREMTDYSTVQNPSNGYGLWTSANTQYYGYYKITYDVLNGSNWSKIFSDPYTGGDQNYENIWQMPFDKSYQPANPFIDLFSVNKSYLFKPSTVALNNWDTETSTNVSNLGDEYRRDGSVTLKNGKYEIYKFVPNFSISTPLETNGKWIIYRAAQLHLRYAEAANQDNKYQFAYSLLSRGLGRVFDPAPPASQSTDTRDVTNIQQSEPGNPTSPYYADARFGSNPGFRAPWSHHYGIRKRVSLADIPIDSAKYFDMNTPVKVTYKGSVISKVDWRPVTNPEALKLYLEDKIIKEDAMELAFEGARWGDLLRFALRRKATDPDFLARMVSAKFSGSLKAEVFSRLQNEKNWYLPFKLQ